MKTVILTLAVMVLAGVTAEGRSHRKTFSVPMNPVAMLGGSPERNPSPKATLKGSPVIDSTIGATLSAKKVPKPLNAKQEAGSSPEGAPAEGASGGESVMKKVVRRQALQYTKNDKLDNGARGTCARNANGTVTVTRKGRSFTGPTEDPLATFQRASHLKKNVNFGQANGLKSPSEGNYIVVNTGGIDYRSFVQPQSDDYYYWTTETDRQLALSGGSPQIQKMGIELLGNGECQLSWGGGGGGAGKEGGDVPATNNGGVGAGQAQAAARGKNS